jgi:hypothetical protein
VNSSKAWILLDDQDKKLKSWKYVIAFPEIPSKKAKILPIFPTRGSH